MNFINNIKIILGRIFCKTKKLPEEQVKIELNNDKVKKIDFHKELKENTDKYFNKMEILEEIEKKPELIYTLPYQRLVQLNELYEERINELELKLKSM